jgi:hypothetical protein
MFAGLTEGWSDGLKRFTTVHLRSDLEGNAPMLASILAHELLHVEQFMYRPDVYADCLQREVPAYQLEADVLRAWCNANPADRFGLPMSCIQLMDVAENAVPETLQQFAARSSCHERTS